jgi:hypothetical protein
VLASHQSFRYGNGDSVTGRPKGGCEDGAPTALIFQQTGFCGKATRGKWKCVMPDQKKEYHLSLIINHIP